MCSLYWLFLRWEKEKNHVLYCFILNVHCTWASQLVRIYLLWTIHLLLKTIKIYQMSKWKNNCQQNTTNWFIFVSIRYEIISPHFEIFAYFAPYSLKTKENCAYYLFSLHLKFNKQMILCVHKNNGFIKTK